MNNSRPRTEAASGPPRQLRVLLVDDSDKPRQALVCWLNSYRCISIVGQAANGREGFALAARLQPDLVITDLNMPELDGLQLVELLRREYPRMRSLLVSCNDSPALHAAGLQHGADAFMTKAGLIAELPGFLARLFPEYLSEKVVAAVRDDRPARQSSQIATGHRLPLRSRAAAQTRSETAQLNA